MNRSRPLCTPVLLACLAGLSSAATLERLSLDDMVQKSTAIVRGRVLANGVTLRAAPGRSGTIYTHYTVQVLERWKGPAATQADLAVPGGLLPGRRQIFPGAPELDVNGEYVFFLWTSRSGLTQIIGLSQGLVNVKVDAGGKPVLSRCASSEPMVDGAGNSVTDSAFSTSLADFRKTMSAYGLGAVK